jgi:ammonium transporter Rh
VGTIFLWIFWPSFNGALASAEGGAASAAQFHCIINTVLSLLGACVATFAASAALEGKLNMVGGGCGELVVAVGGGWRLWAACWGSWL